MFVFPTKSGKSAALVRRRPLIFAPTVAKTVAIEVPSMCSPLDFRSLDVTLLYMVAASEWTGGTGEKHGIPMRVAHLAADIGREVAEALRDILVMVGGEAAKRAIWG